MKQFEKQAVQDYEEDTRPRLNATQAEGKRLILKVDNVLENFSNEYTDKAKNPDGVTVIIATVFDVDDGTEYRTFWTNGALTDALKGVERGEFYGVRVVKQWTKDKKRSFFNIEPLTGEDATVAAKFEETKAVAAKPKRTVTAPDDDEVPF